MRCRRCSWFYGCVLLPVLLLSTRSVQASAPSGISEAAVKRRVEELTTVLLSRQQGDGSWPESGYRTGGTALVLLALKHAGLPNNHPAVARAIDYVVGGPSFRRGRRHPRELRVGDVIDSWRVIALEPEKRLTLLMEMKAPGAGVLEFLIDDRGDKRIVTVRAYWHPAGVWGLLYWFLTLPIHAPLFRKMAEAIAQRASATLPG